MAPGSVNKASRPSSRNLYSHWDRNSIISRLPNQFLESVFLQRAHDLFWTDGPYTSHFVDFPYPWFIAKCGAGLDPRVADLVHVSRVSSHWRSVALNCPTLWSYIFVTSPQWTQIALERSRGMPLKIQIDMKAQRISNSDLLAATELLLSHADRIQELRFRACSWDTVTIQVFTRLLVAASKLRMLDLSFLPVIEARPVFDRHTPSPWGVTYKLGGLTTLRLRSVPLLFPRGIADVQAFLKCMPGLVHLEIEDVLPEVRGFISSPEFSALKKIDLPLLSRLMIIAPLSSVVVLLSCMNIPACKQLTIECSYDTSETDYNQLCPFITELFNKDHALSLPTIRSMVMKTGYLNVVLVFSTSFECDYSPRSGAFDWDSNIVLELSFQLPPKLGKPTFINNICSLIPTAHVSDLAIYGSLNPCKTTQTFWRNTLSHFPALRRMELHSIFVDDKFASIFPLYPVGEHVENRDQHEIVAPELEEIKFIRSTFRKLVDPLDQPMVAGTNLALPPFRDLQPFLTALSSRKGSQPQLILTKCNLHHDCDNKYDMVAQWDGQFFHVVKSQRLYFIDEVFEMVRKAWGA